MIDANVPLPRIGVLVIGDEILSGKRQDRHFAHVVATLAKRGLAAAWAHYEGDDREALTRTLRASFASGDIVLSFGGVGATPDDHTRQAAAAALGVPLAPHPEAVAALEAQFGKAAYPHRVHMAEFPAGATIIPNPVNRVASFSVRDHHFFPGFPQMAWPMVEWVLDTNYRDRFNAQAWKEQSILVFEAGESQLIPAMQAVEAAFKSIKVFSLPSMGQDGSRIHVELGVRGDPAQVEPAMQKLRQMVGDAGFPYK